LALRANQKLAFKFFGPYRVVANIASVAYRLKLPAFSSMHPVFHVSQLKKAVSHSQPVSQVLPNDSFKWTLPEQILQQRSVDQGDSFKFQVLVKLSNMPDSLATWEDLVPLKQCFPRATIWGQTTFQGEGDVSTPGLEGNLKGMPALELGPMPRRRNPKVYGPG